jgi:hypothetical protein
LNVGIGLGELIGESNEFVWLSWVLVNIPEWQSNNLWSDCIHGRGEANE